MDVQSPGVPVESTVVDFHLDVLSPYAYQSSKWIRNVRNELNGTLSINWRFFSLYEVNRNSGDPHPWEQSSTPSSWSLLRVGAMLRRASMDHLDRWYERIGQALFEEGCDPREPDLAGRILAEIGLDPGLGGAALADDTTNDEVLADHGRVIKSGGFGVPTLFIGDQCLFGPALINPPEGAAAVRLWTAVTAWAEFPNLYELQRPKSESAREAIAVAFQNNVAASDWNSGETNTEVVFTEQGFQEVGLPDTPSTNSRPPQRVDFPAIDALFDSFDSLDELLSDLTDEEWELQTPCPAWDVAGVVTHLASMEYILANAAPSDFAESVPFEQAGELVTEVKGAAPAKLLARYKEIVDQRRFDLSVLTEEHLAEPAITPVGRADFARLLTARAFDFWVHEQDIRTAVGKPGHESGGAAELALAEIERVLGYIIGKKAQLPNGESVTIELTGPMARTIHVVVDGRAAVVESLEDPTVTLRTDSTTFARLACGRIDPALAISSRLVTYSGDEELAEHTIRHLAFTM